METRAAVAFEADKPLSIEMVQLEGPREGECLVEIKATGVCHQTNSPVPATIRKACSRPSWATKGRVSLSMWVQLHMLG